MKIMDVLWTITKTELEKEVQGCPCVSAKEVWGERFVHPASTPFEPHWSLNRTCHKLCQIGERR